MLLILFSNVAISDPIKDSLMGALLTAPQESELRFFVQSSRISPTQPYPACRVGKPVVPSFFANLISECCSKSASELAKISSMTWAEPSEWEAAATELFVAAQAEHIDDLSQKDPYAAVLWLSTVIYTNIILKQAIGSLPDVADEAALMMRAHPDSEVSYWAAEQYVHHIIFSDPQQAVSTVEQALAASIPHQAQFDIAAQLMCSDPSLSKELRSRTRRHIEALLAKHTEKEPVLRYPLSWMLASRGKLRKAARILDTTPSEPSVLRHWIAFRRQESLPGPIPEMYAALYACAPENSRVHGAAQREGSSVRWSWSDNESAIHACIQDALDIKRWPESIDAISLWIVPDM